MASTEKYLQQLQTDKSNLIAKFNEKGLMLDSSATFTDIVNEFDNLPSGGVTPAQGLIIDEYNKAGRVTKISIVGFTTIPSNYFQSLFNGNSMFSPITSLVIPEGVTEIKDYGLASNAGLTNITLPQTLKILGTYACSSLTNITSLTLPESLETIGTNCFRSISKLTRLNIPSKVTTIPDYGIYTNTKLETVVLKGETINLGSKALASNSALKYVVLPNVTSVGTMESNAFEGTPIANLTGGHIYVPDALVDTFKSATNWSKHAGQIYALSQWNGE